MATRSMIVFSERDDEYLNYGIPIYKHWDGYPQNVLHVLRNYLNINKRRRDDISYLSAGFLRFVENHEFEEEPNVYENKDNIDEEFQDPYMGYGLYENRIPKRFFSMWEEYYYKVTPTHVYVYDGCYKKDLPKCKKHPELMYKIAIDDLVELPDKRDYFVELEKEISENYYPGKRVKDVEPAKATS